MIGPPKEAPYWLLWNGALGVPTGLKALRASNALLRKYSPAVPCKPLVPLLVTMLTIAPALRPYSGWKFESTFTSATASRGKIVAGVPNHTRIRKPRQLSETTDPYLPRRRCACG